MTVRYPSGERRKLTAINTPTNDGGQTLLETGFEESAPNDSWHIGFVDAAGFVTYDKADTPASHAGWTEILPVFDEGFLRMQIFGASPVIAGDNLSAVVELAGGPETVGAPGFTARGISVASTISVFGGGIYWATADFVGGPVVFPTGTVIESITYTVTLAS